MSHNDLNNELDSLLKSYELNEDNKVSEKPKRRLCDALKLRNIHETLKRQDRVSERNRSKIQDMVDGKPPLNPDFLKKRGRGYQFNVNFGEGASLRNEAMSHYLDLFTSPEFLLDIKLRSDLEIPPTERKLIERTLSAEYTKMVRDWEGSMPNFLMLADQFVTHGVGIGYFTDSDTWQYNTTGLGEFKFPRRTRINSDSIDVCTCETEMTVAELSKYINDESAAEAAGWDVELCKMVMARNQNRMKYDHDSYEDNQEQAKANDYNESDGLGSISVIQTWVQEMDGKISYYIASKDSTAKRGQQEREDEEMDKRFMFKNEDAYPSMEEAIHIFPYYTGNRGNIYTVRGLGYMVHSLVNASNQIQCAALDSTRAAMSIKVTAPSEKSMDQLPIVQAGPYTIMPPTMQIVENQVQPDLSRIAQPSLEYLNNQINKMSSSSSMSQLFTQGQDRRSAMEVSSAMEHFTTLNSAAIRLFFKPWRSLLVQSAKRAFTPEQMDNQAGKLAKIMHERCAVKGVVPEMFQFIDWIETNTRLPIGLGNKASRSALYAEGASLRPAMDDAGKQQFDIDRAIDLYGEKAGDYIPLDGQARELPDHQIARLENNDLLNQEPIQVSNSEDHRIHLFIHTQSMVEIVDTLESGEADLRSVTPGLASLYEHSAETLERLRVDGEKIPEFDQYEQTLQQIGEVVQNGLRQLEADQRKAQEEMMAAAQQGGASEGDQIELQKLELERAKVAQALEHKQAEHDLKMQHQIEQNQVDIAKKDAELAANLERTL